MTPNEIEKAKLLDAAIADAERVNEGVPRCMVVEGIMFWTDGRQPTYCNGEPVDGDEARAVLAKWRKALGAT